MDLPEYLTLWPDDEIVLTGHRIGLYSVVDRYQQGAPPEEIHEEFPTLPLDPIRQVLRFYEENRAEVGAYVADYRAELRRQEADYRPNPAALRIRRLMEEARRTRSLGLSLTTADSILRGASMDLPEFLNLRDGEIRIAGRRIGLYHILDLHGEGATPEAIAEEFELAPALVRQVLDFAAVHRGEVDTYMAAYRAELERQEEAHPPSPAVLRIRRIMEEARRASAT